MESVSDCIAAIIAAVRPPFIVLSKKQMTAYKRELVPSGLPDIALALLVRIRANHGGHTALVTTKVITADGTVIENDGGMPIAILYDAENPVVLIRT